MTDEVVGALKLTSFSETDVDECNITSVCPSGFQCVNTIGSYNCTGAQEGVKNKTKQNKQTNKTKQILKTHQTHQTHQKNQQTQTNQNKQNKQIKYI